MPAEPVPRVGFVPSCCTKSLLAEPTLLWAGLMPECRWQLSRCPAAVVGRAGHRRTAHLHTFSMP